MSQARILVVDDERFFREAIREALEPHGLPVRLVSDGESALAESSDPGLAVVVLDLQLPDLHGLEVFRRLRATRPDLRVIILSAHTDQEYVLEALRLGACDYLAKPLHEEELRLAVRRALQGFELAASHERLREGLVGLERALAELHEKARAARGLPAEIRSAAVDRLEALLGVTRASLLVPDEGPGELRAAASCGEGIPAEQMDPAPVGEVSSLLEAAGAEVPLAQPDERGASLARAICEAVTSEIEPVRILNAALRPVAELLAAAPVSLYLRTTTPEGAERELLVREAEWDGGLASDRPQLSLGRGLTGSVLETGRLVATADPAADPRFAPEVDTAGDGSVRPLLCGPLRFRSRILGLFRVFPAAAADADPALAEVLGAALSAAVRNVLLYRSLVETIEEVAVARREAAAAGWSGAPSRSDGNASAQLGRL